MPTVRRLTLARLAIALLACAPGSFVFAQPAEPLTVYYNERPPYMEAVSPQDVRGLTATPAARAFAAAGIPMRWVELPSNRQLASIQANRVAACALGWFRTPEREAFARFSKPLYQDAPPVVLANADVAINARTLEALLARRDLMLLVKDGYSYGPRIDAAIQRLDPPRSATTVESVQMAQIVARHHADYMIAGEEEAAALMRTLGPAAAHLQVARLSDMPPGERRHLMCSKRVPEALMQRLNVAIAD